MLKEVPAPRRKLVRAVKPFHAFGAKTTGSADAGPTVVAPACDVAELTGHRSDVLTSPSPLRALEGACVVTHGVPLQAPSTIDQSLSCLTAIRARPQAGLRRGLTRGLIQLDGASRQAQPHEVALGATRIPRPPMPKRMTA